MKTKVLLSCIILLAIIGPKLQAEIQVYSNTFDDITALNGFTIIGEEFVDYDPPSLHDVTVEAGQLTITTTYNLPNGPGNNPRLTGRAAVMMDTSSFGNGYDTEISKSSDIISWSFNLSNQDGDYNNGFEFVIISTKQDPYDISAHGYSFQGGGMVGNRMMLRRFDCGLGGGSEIMIDITDGLGPLPEKGSFKITYNPFNSEWALFGDIGVNYTNPEGVDSLLGKAIENTYTTVSAPYTGCNSRNTGVGYFDNLSVFLGQKPIQVEMVVIPGGEFEMGDHFAEGGDDELPLHAVLVDEFFMSKFEITNQQYCDYLNSAYPGQIKVDIGIVYAASDNGNSYPFCDIHSFDPGSQIDFSDPDFSVRTKGGRDMSDDPMVEVSWYGAVAYCNWRSSEAGYESCYNLSTWDCDFSKHGYRLATEAEWEYAARGGEHNPYYRFGWGDTISHGQANYYACTSCYSYDVSPTEGFHPTWHDGIHPYTSIVGSFQANGYGLYDMTGNVWEWCNDWYDSNYYDTSPYDNPEGPASGSGRVLRGGSWFDYAGGCRVAYRSNYDSPGFRYGSNGFRIVRDSEPTNSPPVADAGDDQIVYICGNETAEIELDGSGSTDADGDELEYLWTWEIEGTLFDANGVSPIIELPVGLHTINLGVDDGLEVSEPNSCVIEVIEGIEVDLRVMPRVINRKSRMTRILAVVQLPAGIDGDDIDGSFWLYPGEIEPRFRRLMTVNGSQKLFMVFDKSELMAAVPANGAVVLEIEAQLISGRCLYGSDRIRIIRRGQGPREQTGLRKGTRSRRNRVQNSR